MSKYYGQSEERLRERFEEAQKNAPSVLFIDELDSIAPKREEVTGEVERRVVAQLLTLMDGLSSRGQVIVIGATNREDAIDPALRRPGRFDREIEIGVPDREGRKEILLIHTRGMPIEGSEEDREALLNDLASITHGFVGADLAALAREAAMKALRRYLPEIDLDKPIPSEILERMRVTKEDFKEALKEVEPSALREVLVEVPRVSWQDVGGLEEVKLQLKEAVEMPIRDPDSFTRMGIRPPRGILLYGPPGTGKTLLAKAVATESEANFISIKGPEIMSKWVGESEKAIRQIFKKAKQVAPCIVFLDEIDSLAPRRGGIMGDSGVTERLVNQLLTSLDGMETMEGVVTVAATNRPDMLDPALMRPGRFDRLLLVPVPDRKTRLEILKVHTRAMPLDPDVILEELADELEGFVGADIEALCREAAMLALREDKAAARVTMKHFLEARKVIHSSVDDETMKFYERIGEDLQKRAAGRRKEEVLGYYR
jgi:transitional endoplasmic reticulum ATPase